MFIVHLRAESERYIFSFEENSFRLGTTEKKIREAKFDACIYLVVQVY